MKPSTTLQTSPRILLSPSQFLFVHFPLFFFPYLLQDFTINATKQLEAELTTKPSLQDINFSYF